MGRMQSVAASVDSLGLDATEEAMLTVLRHFLTSFAKPESQAWIMAFGLAGERWGLSDGARMAQGMLGVLQAVMACRRMPIRFSDPMCPRCREKVTADEAAFLLMLHSMRRDNTQAARLALADLTDGQMDAAVMRAGLSLAGRFPVTEGLTRDDAPFGGAINVVRLH